MTVADGAVMHAAQQQHADGSFSFDQLTSWSEGWMADAGMASDMIRLVHQPRISACPQDAALPPAVRISLCRVAFHSLLQVQEVLVTAAAAVTETPRAADSTEGPLQAHLQAQFTKALSTWIKQSGRKQGVIVALIGGKVSDVVAPDVASEVCGALDELAAKLELEESGVHRLQH